MQITRKQWVVAGLGFLAVALAIGVWLDYTRTTAPAFPIALPDIASSTESSAAPKQESAAVGGPFPINPNDVIASWNFKGAYVGNDTLIAQATADSAKLKSLLGTGQYDDYDLYLGLGNDENLMGNGKGAYQYFNRSISIHPNKGLAYANIGHLMDELGAYYTAADAFAESTVVEPSVLRYHVERLIYLTRQFPKDNARIAAALTDANKQFGDNASVLTVEARWLSDQGRYADAIKAWETVKMLSPGKDMTAIDTEIARLKAKQ
jgi:tetratricopeptide (TPR) repeat protein